MIEVLPEIWQFIYSAKEESGWRACLAVVEWHQPSHRRTYQNSDKSKNWWRLALHRILQSTKVANQEDSWSVLRHLASQLDLPWVCVSDFNEITKVEEKFGGAILPEKQMQDFRDCQVLRGKFWYSQIEYEVAKPKLDYGLLRWCPKAFDVMSSLSNKKQRLHLTKTATKAQWKTRYNT